MVAMQGSTENEDGYYKTSFSVFVAILYLKVLYILVMTLLCLSHWNSKEQVFVPAEVARELKPEHFDPIRFLYNCYTNNLGGAILSQSDDMNFPLQLAAFLCAIRNILKGSVLVLAYEDRMGYWYYHLAQHSQWNMKLDLDDSEEPSVTLLSFSDENKLKLLSNRAFAMVIVDDFERVAKKTTIRKLTGTFKVGLTHRNFINSPDQRLQWTMLRWSNPKHIGTFESFCEMDGEHLATFTEPFTQFWQRRTWDFCDGFKRGSDEEAQLYKENVQKWLEERKFKFAEISETIIKRRKKASKRKSCEKENTKGKRKVIKKSTKAESENFEVQPKIEFADSSDTTGFETRQEPIKNSDDSSSDTIIYETSDVLEEKPVCHQLPSMEVSPIVQSILDGFCQSPVKQENLPKRRNSEEILSFLFDDSSSSRRTEVDIKDSFQETSSYYCDREKLLSELFDE